MKTRFEKDLGMSAYDSEGITSSRDVTKYFLRLVDLGANPKLSANWVLGNLFSQLNDKDINILDLTRLWRCFPDEDLADLLNNAVDAVTNSDILEYWADSKPRYFSLVEWVDALYHLCTLKQDASYRQFLAEGIIRIEDMELGLPPSLLGADPEAVNITERIPCPSATNPHLRIANLSCSGHIELLVINATSSALQLIWERETNYKLSWTEANNQPPISDNSQFNVHARS